MSHRRASWQWRRLGSLLRSLVGVFTAAVLLVALSSAVAVPAEAHAELLQASPERNSVVGGEFHSVILQFFDLDENAPQAASLYDPAGNEIPSTVARSGQRLVIPIDPLTTPGDYLVRFTVTGVDGDLTNGEFTFRYDPQAPEPEGITRSIGGDEGFDYVSFGLLLAAAAIAAFLLQRVLLAWREHRNAQAERTDPAAGD